MIAPLRRALGILGTVGLAAAGVALVPTLAQSYSSGAPSGFVYPDQNCTACHGDFGQQNTGTGSVTITAPTAYVPGTPIAITIDMVNTTPGEPTPRQGFQVSIRDADTGDFVGAFDLGGSTAVQLAQGNPEFVTHTASSTTETSWSFAWVPPTDDPPAQVILYAAANAADGDGTSDSDDFVYTAQQTLTASVASENGPEASTRLEATAPNPVASLASSALVLGQGGAVSVRLYDGRGRAVRTLLQGTRPAGRYALGLDAAGLSDGTYFLVAETPEGRRTRPVVVVR